MFVLCRIHQYASYMTSVIVSPDFITLIMDINNLSLYQHRVTMVTCHQSLDNQSQVQSVTLAACPKSESSKIVLSSKLS